MICFVLCYTPGTLVRGLLNGVLRKRILHGNGVLLLIVQHNN